MITIAVVGLLILLVLGVPVCFAIGLSGLLAIMLGSDIPSLMAAHQAIRGMNSFSLMAGPLFILAGEIMGAANLSKRILDFCRACIAQVRGGMGIVSVLANMIFAGISGSGAATMSAVSTLTVPELKKEGYDSGFIASMIAGSGALAPIIPPSTNMIVYASLTGFSVGKLFLGGLVPGILIGICLMVMCYWYARKHNVDGGSGHFSFRAVGKAFVHSFFALITPVIILAGVVSGKFTATESGIVACIYALICGFFIYRTLKLSDLVGIFKRAASSSAMLMMIMGISSIYSYIFARENLAEHIKNFMLSISQNPAVVVFIIIVIMLIIGCFMETLAATAVILPIVYPIITSLGVDPLLFGVLFSISTVVGALTPPVGLYLFLSMNIAEAPFRKAISYTAPVVLIILAVMLLMWFFPPIVTLVPNLLMGA
ncbi:TRAP transporter permease DctM [Flavonifractor sp. An92]|uniref:TRAP transporter large permease n=1 Tax=Flavonifractor sp. An92 TaxID=1965666 RepID=UPI000B37B4EF|nr:MULTISPECIES: TRAP transporter large permease [unclassified Flavonifractor]OUN06135.1 TRAP transporter permease DctM [Flavonifractor sp. An92]OUQ22369.1 TRAP transporter permease DctM [Flavonifractor sp. An135]